MDDVENERAREKLQRALPAPMRHAPPPPPVRQPTVAVQQQLRDAVARLRGVREARVNCDAAGMELVVLTVPEKLEADTQAEVRRLAQRIGLDTKAFKVRVLGARSSSTPPNRRKLSSLATKRYGERFTAQVTLELHGDALVGEVEVPSGRRFEYRSVSRAVLESVRRLIPYALQLENVDIFNFGADRLAVVSVSSRSDTLVGSAFVRTDELDAIARATLDAINRVIDLRSNKIVRTDPVVAQPTT